MLNKESTVFVKLAYAVMFLPFFIFILGWIKWYYSIPMAIVLLFCFMKLCKAAPALWVPDLCQENLVRIFFIIAIIVLWVYFSGIGKFVFQNTDHYERNAIFNILVEYKWPVTNTNIVQDISSVKNVFSDTSKTGLIYYIGYWLPSAIIGKLFGIRIGYYAQAAWGILLIILVYYFICAHLKKLLIWPLVVMIFFSGLDIVGHYLTGTDLHTLESSMHLEWWSNPYQFTSMTSQLFWVFNQAIPAWLCTMLLVIQKKNHSIIFILACSLLTSTFPFIGLLGLSIFYIFSRHYENVATAKEYLNSLLKDLFTVQNFVGGSIIGIISFIYLIGNSAGSIVAINVRGSEFNNSLPKYIVFMLVEISVYFVLLYKYNKNNKLYFFIIICLFVIPPIKIGYSTDFCMRASIPILFVLMLMVIESLERSLETKDYKILIGILAALVIGSITPVHEFTRTVSQTFLRIKNDEIVYQEDMPNDELLSLENFAGDVDESFFYKYLAK